MRNRFIVGALTLGLLVGLAAGATAGEKWGPFKGQIVDVETGQGIEGAVVLAIWTKMTPNVAGASTEFFDAREAVTGPDGRFLMPRRDPPFFTMNIPEPNIKVFAPGYGDPRWVVTPETGEPLVDPTAIEMRKLKTRVELERKSHTYPSYVPIQKMQQFINAINLERKMQGLKPIGK
jgi:hypothetical protein